MEKNLQECTVSDEIPENGNAFWLVFLLAVSTAWGQEFTVSGQVRENGNPLPGVSILEKGTIQRTTSDAQGNFNLTVLAFGCFSFQFYRL